METIVKEELESIAEGWYEKLHAAQERLIAETVGPLLGRQLTVTRSFGERSRGIMQDQQVAITITGARMGYDDALELIGTYEHPISGKLQETYRAV
jgi:hypothetical protein